MGSSSEELVKDRVDCSPIRMQIDEVSDELVQQSTELLLREYTKYESMVDLPTPELYVLENNKVLIDVTILQDSSGLDWISFVVLPLRAFVEPLQEGNSISFMISLAIMISMLCCALFLVIVVGYLGRRYGKRKVKRKVDIFF